MNRYERYLSLSAEIIDRYNGTEPFSVFLKKYFTLNKKLGSRDRKQISDCCYAYFRSGHLLEKIEMPARIAAGLFLCKTTDAPILEYLYPHWHNQLEAGIEEKCAVLGIAWVPSLVFPWMNHLSSSINPDLFVKNHFIQPDLFLRIRKGERERVITKLKAANIPFRSLSEDAIVLPNGTKIDDLLFLNREVVVQDYSSQQIAHLFKYLPHQSNDQFKTWDICAASGGKSILLKDYFPNTILTVSDKRNTILHNLHRRFEAAGISYENAYTIDLTKEVPQTFKKENFDLIMADVPCSGSGTWSRTPEWLRFFDLQQLMKYVDLQNEIIRHVLPFLKKDGYLLYATCSVFKEENEEQVAKIAEQFGLRIIASQMFKGYEDKADTMYGALMQKS